MDVTLSPDDLAFRQTVRDFLSEKFTPELRAASARQSGVFAEPQLARQWLRILNNNGWAAPHWPPQYGGTGWNAIQRHIFNVECGLAGTPQLPGMGLQMCGPVLMRFGTEKQKAFFLPRILSGEHYWCQGYSEPDSGSDLASLSTRAVRDGDDFVVSGTKIWTTHAHAANWMFLLARTTSGGRPQSGISFLLTPLDAPGISVTPIISMSGEHEVNSVFFDNVRVPAGNLVGQENEGWTVAKYLLEFERGGMGATGRLQAQLRRLRNLANETIGDDGQSLARNCLVRETLAQIETDILAIEWTELRQAAARDPGSSAGNSTASMLKLIISEATQRISEFSMHILGPYAAADQQDALRASANPAVIGPEHALTPTAIYLNARAATIFGGSSEVQRNILAKAALGL